MVIDNMVPHGMDNLGFFKSPLIATPAVNPVTAGKKIPNKTEKLGASMTSVPTFNPSDEPKNTENKESTIKPKMTY